jgi:membrane protease subunit (stomatin/prohibitin family)
MSLLVQAQQLRLQQQQHQQQVQHQLQQKLDTWPATELSSWADTRCLKMGMPEDDETKVDRVSKIQLLT